MNLNNVVTTFVDVVVDLMNYRLSSGAKIYIETKESRYINFKPISFRRKLQSLVGEKLVHEYLDYFRRLDLIVVKSGEKKFTNIQWINRKSVRVITIEKSKLETLIELINNSN